MKLLVPICILFLVLSHAKCVLGEMYEWVDSDGRKHCTNVEPRANSSEPKKPEENNLGSIQTKKAPQHQTNNAQSSESANNKLSEGNKQPNEEAGHPQGPKSETPSIAQTSSTNQIKPEVTIQSKLEQKETTNTSTIHISESTNKLSENNKPPHEDDPPSTLEFHLIKKGDEIDIYDSYWNKKGEIRDPEIASSAQSANQIKLETTIQTKLDQKGTTNTLNIATEELLVKQIQKKFLDMQVSDKDSSSNQVSVSKYTKRRQY